jgi:indole-3-glycerol phosphate synthase
VIDAKKKVSMAELERNQRKGSGGKFLTAIHQSNRVSVIAEMKKKSPSAGLIRSDYDVQEISRAYESGGASALSVLTEMDWFGGELDDMQKVSAASNLPILRKDFIFDPYQVIEARAFGASAILLIADMIDAKLLKELVACAREQGLETLTEVFTPEVLETALETGSKIIGINTRNLRTLEMFPNRVAELKKEIPSDRVVVAESGIKTSEDVKRLKSLGVSAILVGESLLKQKDLKKALNELVSAGVKP